MNNAEIAHLRAEYTKGQLDVDDVLPDPLKQFELWFGQALNAGITEPNAMTLSTVSPDKRPSSRTVLLKGVDAEGFVFYTNYNSRKGKQLSANPYASLVFLWLELQRQVLIEGITEKVSKEESDEYFAVRPRESQLGAVASEQSTEIESRNKLENNFKDIEDKYKGKPVPRPENWGGFRLIPNRIEFWQGRENRLHDRVLYLLNGNSWEIKRLAP